MCPSDPSNPPAPTELRVANMSFGPGSTVGARIEWSMPPDLDVPIHHYKVSWSWTAVGHSSASSLTKRRKTVRKVRMPQLQMEHVSLRPKKDIMHVMFSETLVEWSVCSMFTSVITTGSKYDLNITWNQWCGVCLIVCLCAQSQVELDSMRTNRSYSVEVQAVSYWGQTQFKGPRAVLHFTTQQSTETRTRHRGFFSSSSKFCREEKKTSSCRLKISPKCRSVFRCLGSLWKLPPFV